MIWCGGDWNTGPDIIYVKTSHAVVDTPPLPTLFNPPTARAFLSSRVVGRRQVVRHRILIPAFGGSIPPAPANFNSDSAPSISR